MLSPRLKRCGLPRLKAGIRDIRTASCHTRRTTYTISARFHPGGGRCFCRPGQAAFYLYLATCCDLLGYAQKLVSKIGSSWVGQIGNRPTERAEVEREVVAPQVVGEIFGRRPGIADTGRMHARAVGIVAIVAFRAFP